MGTEAGASGRMERPGRRERVQRPGHAAGEAGAAGEGAGGQSWGGMERPRREKQPRAASASMESPAEPCQEASLGPRRES